MPPFLKRGFLNGELMAIENIGRLPIVNGDTQVVLLDHYTRAYVQEKEDSPDLSRVRLARKIHAASNSLSSTDHVLDLGAGRQILERDYRRLFGRADFNFVTVDIAGMQNHQLLERSFGPTHIRASGVALPFRDGFFSMAVSNMALDFMPRGAIDELHRVMRPDSTALVNLHHTDLIPQDLDQRMAMSIYSKRAKATFKFWGYLRDNDLLCKNEDDVVQMFGDTKFKVEGITLAQEPAVDTRTRPDKWWEVVLRA